MVSNGNRPGPLRAVVGKRGQFVIPHELRKQFGIEDGGLLIAEATDRGILIRPAVAVPVERYTKEREAEFLLNNAIDAADYKAARQQVKSMGLDPDAIPHERP